MPGYKSKTIKAALRGKISSWLKTIEDEDLKKAIKDDVIVTGGSIASMLLGEPVKDYDVYFRTQATAKLVAEYYSQIYMDEMKAKYPTGFYSIEVKLTQRKNLNGETEEVVGVRYEGSRHGAYEGKTPDMQAAEAVEGMSEEDGIALALENTTDKKYFPVYISENAITLSNKVQIVLRFTGEPEQIHKNYDFAHCKNVYTFKDDNLILNNLALECLLSKTLRYTGSLYPLCSIFRAKKFIERGWRISAGELLKIAYQVAKIDFNNLEMLREQLVGVDALYFHDLMGRIKAATENQEGRSLDEGMLVELIDQVFNS